MAAETDTSSHRIDLKLLISQWAEVGVKVEGQDANDVSLSSYFQVTAMLYLS